MALDSPYTLNNVRTMTNYGFYIIGNTYDPIFTKGVINSKPNISINGATCIIDYSHVFDVSEVIYLKRTFGGLSAGNTFGMPLSNYYDEFYSVNTTVGGTCTFNSTLNDGKIIVGTRLSGFTLNTDYNYYSKENFTTVPQYTFNATGGTIGCFLVNSLPNLNKLSFKKLGIVGSIFGFEEYIDLSGGTADNATRIPVYGTVTLKDGQEVLYFTSGGTTQNFINTGTTLNLYLRGRPSLLTAPYTSDTTGIFTIYNSSTGNLLYCFANQSLNQSTLRKYLLTSPYVGYFDSCPSCYDLIYGDVGTSWSTVLPEFTNLIYIKLTETSTVETVTALSTYTTSSSLFPVTITSSSNNILKIDLSHPSLIGYNLQLYYDGSYNIPVGTAFNVYGVAGYNGSYAILTSYVSPSTIYGVLSGKQNLYFTIAV